jgi:adenylyl-sulfate kinase
VNAVPPIVPVPDDPKHKSYFLLTSLGKAASANPSGNRLMLDSRPCDTKEGMTVWLTGLPCSGKTTLGLAVTERLKASGWKVELLDGDVVRRELWRELSFSKADREENVRRFGFLAGLLSRHGIIAVVSAVSPYRVSRNLVRGDSTQFLEVYVNAPLAVCEQRDVKGMYRKARAGELAGFTGVADPYEAPLHPEVECRTDLETVEESVAKIVAAIEAALEETRSAAGSQA